jgi:DNA polymerase-3 subunit beta
MNLTIPKSALLRLVAHCQGVADKKSAMPVLASCLLSADGDQLRVSATNMYSGITGSATAEVSEPGSIALPARELLERVKAMPEGPIRITTTSGDQATIKAGTGSRRFVMMGTPGIDFPPLPKVKEDAPTLALEGSALLSLIEHTVFSISTDETRAHVNSALFEWKGDTLRMVSTDGHRLSKYEAKAPSVAQPESYWSMLIPLKAVNEIRRLMGESKATPKVTLASDKANIFVSIGGLQFFSRLTEAQFPPYQQVIPKHERKFHVERTQLLEAVNAVRVAASERSGGVKLTVTPTSLRVTAESPEVGNAYDEFVIESEGAEMTIGVNAKYIVDVLSATSEKQVAIAVGGDLDPMLLTLVGNESFVGVVMPMRV